MIDATTNTVGTLVTPSGQTTVTLNMVLAPMAINSVGLNSANTGFQPLQVQASHLKWLMNTSGNFGYYRVTRARLIFVGNQGTTTAGSLNLFGTKDSMDLTAGINTAYMSGNSAKTFDLSQAGSREIALNLPVDSAWKKISSTVATPASTLPFTGNSTGFVNVNSIGDLSFCSIAAQVTGGVQSTNYGTLFIDYDIEFKDPMSSVLNF